MSKTRKDREGNIRLRADGRWEVRVTIGIDYATGEERRISRYGVEFLLNFRDTSRYIKRGPDFSDPLKHVSENTYPN